MGPSQACLDTQGAGDLVPQGALPAVGTWWHVPRVFAWLWGTSWQAQCCGEHSASHEDLASCSFVTTPRTHTPIFTLCCRQWLESCLVIIFLKNNTKGK